MANGNKKTDELGVDRDDDPTAELEVLPQRLGAKSETHRRVDSEAEIELLRSNRTGLEKKIEVLEEALSNISKEVKKAHEKHFRTSELLEKRDNEIRSLRSQLLGKAQDIEECRMSEIQTGSERRAISASTSRVVGTARWQRIERSSDSGRTFKPGEQPRQRHPSSQPICQPPSCADRQ